MARITKRAGDIEVGDAVLFPGSRRPRTVGQVLSENATVSLISDDASSKWMCGVEHEVSVEVEDPQPVEDLEASGETGDGDD